MLNEEIVEIEGKDGAVRKFALYDIPYLDGGREVATQFMSTAFMSTAMPKVVDYSKNEDLAAKMFKYIAVVQADGVKLPLSTKDLVNNHVPDFITGIKLEEAMLKKQLGFSVAGKLREFQQGWKDQLPELISTIMTQLQAASSPPAKPRSKSSKKTTPSRT